MADNLDYLENNSELPKLPVPPMEESLERLLKTVKPLVSEEEYKECEQKAKDLMDPSKTIGRTLHERLVERSKDPNIISWVEEWWNDVAYFQNRQSICFHVNYFFGFRKVVTSDGSKPTQTKLAAAVVNSITNYRADIINGTFKKDTVRGRNLCMSQFRYQFGVCRIPGATVDHTEVYPFSESRHIAVAYKGKFYHFLPYYDDGSVMSVHDIESILNALVKEEGASKTERGECIGILTALERDDWYYARSSLLKVSERNVSSLEMIQSSSFLLSLDDSSPETYAELSQACYTSDGVNRFYDKCFQVLIFANGRYGFNGEHSLTDGTTDNRLAKHFVQEVETYFSEQENVSKVNPPSQAPERIHFDCDNTLKRFIRRAWSYFDHYLFRQEIAVCRFDEFGKDTIKKFKVSPDSFAQMSIQLAYYKLFDHFVATYESASTRSFARGRTETSRSISEASVAWCKTMVGDDPRQLAGEEISAHEKIALLRQSIANQSEYTAAASRAHGVDRYFMGLRQSIHPGETWPELFFDAAFKKSSYWQLSTSQISEEFMDAYGWGQVVYDGFGIAYMVLPNAYHFNVASTHLGSQRMCDQIVECMHEMYELLISDADEVQKLEIKSSHPKKKPTSNPTSNPPSRPGSIRAAIDFVSNKLGVLSLAPGLTASEKT
ncbi:hypothetical protein BB560_003827 [Smittium megazygosporum]|uniref:Choline/carnitine acyltransferase domain-containing protein n=1 Tax=Smittium megazygosporum TaxID=133381 RepID=A0A2T9ZAY7_9FUNG|nr:hypothetical protein BB560_003827 [Smittium megazygosporum]